MRWNVASLLGSALLAHRAVADLVFTVEATRKGNPIPQSEIKFERIELGHGHVGHGRPSQARRRIKRTNPTATSGNWCGSVNTTPSSNPIKIIHASYQHPTCSLRSGSTYPQVAANWIGIDGDTWTSALLQAGTMCQINNSTGAVTYQAWWQWVPESAYSMTSMPVSPNDWIDITITTTSNNSAEIQLSNLSQSQTYTVTIPSGGPTLARVNADWVVERPYYGSALAGFPQFTDMWFDAAYANLTSSATPEMGILGAKQYQMSGLCESEEWDDQHEVSWSLD